MSGNVDIEEIKAKARELVIQADAEGKLEELTPRLVRHKIEQLLSLEDGVLDEKEHKNAIKNALNAALDELGEPPEAKVENSSPKVVEKPPSKRKSPEGSDVEAPAKKPKTVRKKTTTKDGDGPEKKTRPRKKAETKQKAAPKDKSKSEPKASRRKTEPKAPESTTSAKKVKAVRSPSVIESSDEEGASGKSPSKAEASSPKKSTPRKVSDSERPKKRQKKAVVESEDEAEAEEPAATSPVKEETAPEAEASTSQDQKANGDTGEKSESQMSVLIDEPPKRRQKKKKEEDSTTKPKRKSKSKAEELSPNEQEIKRLKSFVTACGVRKVWSRELKDMSERDQISHIKRMLADLGMTGRLSIEKAKAIRAKRELAQELEDVQEFEKAVLSGPGGSRRTRKQAADAESVPGDSDEEAPPPKRRISSARASINAFLDDQSDDE
ncbi:hypothetical protein NM688_g688 [Phlebia brevispora]|uniref:Uncharacterized protein n=1 Tax=Phlebia brevispora TaxID=194682 RepID=A0ACC1TDA4_9APHY|nr:hypothetical protein NM688_g688 [Phlebia brevispora]